MTAQVQQQLLAALKKIDRPGTFCTSGRGTETLVDTDVRRAWEMDASSSHAGSSPIGTID